MWSILAKPIKALGLPCTGASITNKIGSNQNHIAMTTMYQLIIEFLSHEAECPDSCPVKSALIATRWYKPTNPVFPNITTLCAYFPPATFRAFTAKFSSVALTSFRVHDITFCVAIAT